MKAVILSCGLGTRLLPETHLRPKPMTEIGDTTALWHITKIDSHYGINGFIVSYSYRSCVIKKYCTRRFLYMLDSAFDGSIKKHEGAPDGE